jgi:hypothetical protein
MEAKHFDLVQIFFIKNRSLLFWPKNSETKQNNLICSGNLETELNEKFWAKIF